MRVRESVCVWASQMDASCDDEWQTAHASNYTRSTYGNGHIIIMHDMVQSPIWWLHTSQHFCCVSHHRKSAHAASLVLMEIHRIGHWWIVSHFIPDGQHCWGVRHSESICPSKRKKKANWSSIFAIAVHVFHSTVAKFNWRETYEFASPVLTASSVQHRSDDDCLSWIRMDRNIDLCKVHTMDSYWPVKIFKLAMIDDCCPRSFRKINMSFAYFASPIIYYYYFDFMRSPANPRCHLSQFNGGKLCIRHFVVRNFICRFYANRNGRILTHSNKWIFSTVVHPHTHRARENKWNQHTYEHLRL